MRFLANENIPGDTVDALRAAGHDVSWVRNDAPGMKDPNILAWAARENRVLLTFDKDFGELARQADLPASCGIVLIRLPLASPATVGKALADRIDERDDWPGHFSVSNLDESGCAGWHSRVHRSALNRCR